MKSKLLMLREFVCSTLIAVIIAMFVVKFIGVKAVVNGTPKTVHVCSRCLRSGKVSRAV